MAVEEKAEKTHREDGFLANPLHGRRNRGMWGGGQCPSHFWDQRGTGGYRGRSNEKDLCFYSSLYSVLYK